MLTTLKKSTKGILLKMQDQWLKTLSKQKKAEKIIASIKGSDSNWCKSK
jgi:hypothetical protein